MPVRSSADLERAYQALLRTSGVTAAPPSEDVTALDSRLRALVGEGRRSEERDGSSLGMLRGKADAEVVAKLSRAFRGKNPLAVALQTVVDAVVASVNKQGMSLAYPVHFGLFPTGSFNAEVTRVPEGALVLVNSGLMTFVKQAADLFARANSVHLGSSRVRAQLSRDKAVHQLTDLAAAYVMYEDSTMAPRRGMQTGTQGMLSWFMTYGAECFVVCHELAHAAAGHVDGSVSRATRAGVTLSVIRKKHDDEFVADIMGLRLLQMTVPRDFERFTYHVAGAYLFFGLDGLLAAIDERLGDAGKDLLLDSDHPPAHERARMLTAELAQQGNASTLPIAKLVEDWFADLTPEVAAAVAQRLTPPPQSPRATA